MIARESALLCDSEERSDEESGWRVEEDYFAERFGRLSLLCFEARFLVAALFGMTLGTASRTVI